MFLPFFCSRPKHCLTLAYLWLARCRMKRSPDFTNVMTECPLEHQLLAGFPSLEKEPVREYAARHAQLSVRGEQVFDRLLVLLPIYLKSQPTTRVSPFPPALLFSICDALQHGRAHGPAEQHDTSVLPSVLSKLRSWRLLDPDSRSSSEGRHRLALDLAGITDEASASTGSVFDHTSHARLRMKWVSSDSLSESPDREPSSSTPPSPSSSRFSVLDSPQECAYALPDLSERRSDTGYESCQTGRLGTPDSEDAGAVVSQRLHSVSGFRSGCSACRHSRVSGPTPPTLQMASLGQMTPFSDVNRFDTNTNTTFSSPRHPKPSVQHTTTKKTKREKHKPSQSISRSAHVNENEPPLATSVGIQQGTGISFPRQYTHYPRISNVLSSRNPPSPAAASVERRSEPNHPNRTREGDKHTSSHRVASVDLRLPMGNHHSSNHASPIDLHPHAPTRAQSFSYTAVNSHGLGSVAARIQKLSSNAVGFRSSKRLPSWSQSHLGHSPTTTTTSGRPTGSSSPPPGKAGLQNPHPFTRLRPSSTSIPPRVPNDMEHRARRSVSTQHKHTQSAGSPSSSPFFFVRKWQV